MANYLELLGKLQAQTLDGLKQVQSAQVATLNTTREMVASLPTMTGTTPTIEGMPTLSQIAELNTQFATRLLEQQKAYAASLAELFTPTPKVSIN